MKNLKVILILSIMLTAMSLPAWIKGNRCLGQWNDGYWYPATVINAEDGLYSVAFDDGDSASLDESRIRGIDWGIGSNLQCNWKGEGHYYPGKITSMNGDSIHVHYDDGDEEDTVIGMCRSI